jgi:mRNA-degrading endonuclease RelE of RelBE toxin-antitoxin system
MNKLDKFLYKLDKKTRAIIGRAVVLIVSGDFLTFDVKKLKGSSNIYRVRIGKIRIIFEQTKNGNKIRDITYRDDNTYKGY